MLSPEIEHLGFRIIGCAIRVHSELGPGLLESAYEKCLLEELKIEGIQAESQKQVSINYKGVLIPRAYYIDILVENEIILELKSVETICPEHKSQLLTYMRLNNSSLGYLINFGAPRIRDGIHRMIWTRGDKSRKRV
jgi:GxxExxY protein